MNLEGILLILSVVFALVGLIMYQKRPAIRNALLGAGGIMLGISFLLNESWIGLLFILLALERLYRVGHDKNSTRAKVNNAKRKS